MGNGCSVFGPKSATSACDRHNAHYARADVSKFSADWQLAMEVHWAYAIIAYPMVSVFGWIWWWRCRIIDIARDDTWTIASFFGASVP